MLKLLLLLVVISIPLYLIYRHGLTGATKRIHSFGKSVFEKSRNMCKKFIEQLDK